MTQNEKEKKKKWKKKLEEWIEYVAIVTEIICFLTVLELDCGIAAWARACLC